MEKQETTDLKDIVAKIKQKDQIENNPFSQFPPDVLRDALDLLDDQLD
jgi:hypothetical protein